MSDDHGPGWELYQDRTSLEKTMASIIVGIIFVVGQAVKSFFLVLFNIVRALI